jgi:hypothetical protein
MGVCWERESTYRIPPIKGVQANPKFRCSRSLASTLCLVGLIQGWPSSPSSDPPAYNRYSIAIELSPADLQSAG